MKVQRPSELYTSPWYPQATSSPSSRPLDSGIRRCQHASSRAAGCPSWRRNRIRLRPPIVRARSSCLSSTSYAAANQQLRGQTGIHHIYKFELHPTALSALPALPSHEPVPINGKVGPASVGPASARQDGSSSTLNVAIAPLVSKDFEQIGRLIIFDDVTDRAELEQRLVQADKLSSIGLLAAGVAHEVNTPLAVISTYAQMLAKQ